MKLFNIRVVIALIAALGLVVSTACSEDAGGDENSNVEENDDEDAGDQDADDEDVEDEDADDNDNGDEDVDDGRPDEFDVDPVECAFPSDDPECEDGEFGPAALFSEFVISTETGSDTCCFDLDDDGQNDNYIGQAVVGPISSIDGFEDINHNIATAIQAGELAYLLEGSYWEHPAFDHEMTINVYRGASTDDTMDDNLAGDGSFRIAERNFGSDGEPLYGFEKAWIEDGELVAKDGYINITIPGLVEGVSAPLADAQLTGDVVQSPEPDLSAGGSFEVQNGELGGAILRDEFYLSLNKAAFDCDCIDLDVEDESSPDPWSEGLLIYDEPNDRWNCDGKSMSDDECTDPGEPVECQTLGDGSFCNLIAGFSDQTDVEVDGEPAFSIGIEFEAVTTEIVGTDAN